MTTSATAENPVEFLTPDSGIDLGIFPLKKRAVLTRIARKVGATQSLDEVMDFLFEASQPLGACDRMSLAFLEEDGYHLVSRYVRTNYSPLLLGKGYAGDIGRSTLGRVIQSGVPRIINDLQEYAEQNPGSQATRLLLKEGIRSSMTCPLSVDGRHVGVLFRNSRHPNAYSKMQMLFHQAVVERISEVVEKAYHIEQLTDAKRAYLETLGFVSHELRNPVASILVNAGLLADGLLGEMPPQQAQEVQRIIAKCNYLMDLIREHLDLARIEDGQLSFNVNPQASLVLDVIDPAIEVARSVLEMKQMSIEVIPPKDEARIECDPELLKIVLVNLLSNAAKYGRQGGKVRIRWQTSDTGVTVAVFNEGVGFPESERPRLFRKFSRLQTPELLSEKGTGIGLYNVWRVVQCHGGQIKAESQAGQWAEFTLTIPQPLPTSLAE